MLMLMDLGEFEQQHLAGLSQWRFGNGGRRA